MEKTLSIAIASGPDSAFFSMIDFSRIESRWKKRAEYAKNSSTRS